MAKKKKTTVRPQQKEENYSPTLKEMLNRDTVDKLNAQAKAWKDEEVRREEERKRQAEEARRTEQKKLENDFAHLLNNSKQDWRKFK